MTPLSHQKRNHPGSVFAGSLEKKILNLQKKFNKKFDLKILKNFANQEKDSLVSDLARCIAKRMESKDHGRQNGIAPK